MKLGKEFLGKYKDFPDHMTELSKFVYYRTYSRWLPKENRRETWKETCARAVEYNTSLAATPKEEAEELFDNMYNLKQFISGRSLWIGGSEASKKVPLAGFNCSFVVIDNLVSFDELFYLLMVGTGVGFRILPSDVAKLPTFRQDVELTTTKHKGMPWGDPVTEYIEASKDHAYIIVGDSKEGWKEALATYLRFMTNPKKTQTKLIIDFTKIRPKGTPLMTFGGTASGSESIEDMFNKIHKVITEGEYSSRPIDGKLRPIHCLDICNLIGQNVVVGGVRRTAEIALIDPKDTECTEAKSNLTPEKYHRFMSNNSLYIEDTPTKEYLQKIFASIRATGEPGFINVAESKRRRGDYAGTNPCGEVLLPANAVCNLTTINLTQFVVRGKYKGQIAVDMSNLKKALRLSARAGYRMTCVDLELPGWNEIHHRDRLLGCSITGYQDLIGMLPEGFNEALFLEEMKKWTRFYADEYAEELGTPKPKLVTSVKPEGTLSLIAGGVSPGVHYQHSPYFIRRIRVNASDPLAKTALELGWQIHPEVGQTMENATTLVIDFPCKTEARKTKNDVSAVDQLKTYLMFQKNYVEHNASNTISVKPDEWEEVVDFVHTNWNDVLGVTFLESNSTYYPLMPYEECTKETYDDLVKKTRKFDPEILNNMEITTRNMGKEYEILDDKEGCENGVCPIR